MLRKFAILIIVLVIAGVEIQAQKSGDEKAIRANIAQMEKGWNAKNGAEFAKPFAENSDYVVINGMYIKGRAAIAAGHQEIFDTFYKASNLTLYVERIRFLQDDVTIVHVSGSLKVTENDSTRKTSARITMVMTKNDDKWEIAAFQNTEIQTGEINNARK